MLFIIYRMTKKENCCELASAGYYQEGKWSIPIFLGSSIFPGIGTLKKYFSFIENDWPLLTINEKQLVYEHIRQYDFPSNIEETIGGLHSLGCPIIETYQPDHRHAMLVLSKE